MWNRRASRPKAPKTPDPRAECREATSTIGRAVRRSKHRHRPIARTIDRKSKGRSVTKLPRNQGILKPPGLSDFLGTFCSHKKYPRGVRGREGPGPKGRSGYHQNRPWPNNDTTVRIEPAPAPQPKSPHTPKEPNNPSSDNAAHEASSVRRRRGSSGIPWLPQARPPGGTR